MIRHWTHVHTLATGLVFGLVLDRESLLTFGIGLILGAGLVLGFHYLRRLLGWGRSTAQQAAAGVEDLRRAEADRKRAAAEELRARADHRLRRVGEQEAAERSAYYAGARDGGRLEQDWPRPAEVLGVEVQP
jgi:hypothetical protein